MNKLFLLAFLLIGCNKPKEVIVKDPDPIVNEPESKDCQDLVLEGSKTKATLSNSWESLTPSVKSIDIAAIHHQSTALLTVSYQDYDGTYDEYVLHSLRMLRNKEVNIDDYSSTTIDGKNFLFTDTTKGSLHVWHFFGVNDSIGYAISCGGGNNTLINDVCSQAIDQIKFK